MSPIPTACAKFLLTNRGVALVQAYVGPDGIGAGGAGDAGSVRAALDNLRRLCEEHFQGRYRIEVVDLSFSSCG